jgi:hypothetical protein
MFSNLNQCKSFNQTITTALVALSSKECSEVVISNKTGQGVLIFDSNNFGASNGFLLSANDVFTFLGVDNSNQLSAQTSTGSGVLYYRTQLFSSTPSR